MKKSFIILLTLFAFVSTAKANYQDECINKYKNSLGIDPYTFCPLDEAKKIMIEIDGYYNDLANVDFLKEWHGGNKMTKGNLKDLKDSWTIYRNKLCSLVGTFWSTIEQDDGSLEKQQAECLLNVVKTHRAYLKNMVDHKDSTPYTDER